MIRREDLVVDHGEVIVAHQHGVGRVIAVVTVGQVAVALLVDVAIARDQQVGARAKDRAYSATQATLLEIGESRGNAGHASRKNRVFTQDGGRSRTTS